MVAGYNRLVSAAWLRGIHPPIPTAFHDDGTLAAPVVSFLRRLADAGLDGVVVLGSNGEAPLLSERERLDWLAAVRRRLPSPLRLIAGTGVHGTRPTIELTRAAADAGAEAALVITPGYFRRELTAPGMAAYYHAVADASPIPILMYNVPVHTGFDVPVDWITSMERHPNIAGLKDSSLELGRISAFREALGPDFVLLAGVGERLREALTAGADGSIAALANLAPAECAAILRLMRQGEVDAAGAIQARIAPVGESLTRRFGVPGLKAALRDQGYDHGPPRAPLPPLPAPDQAALHDLLRTAGLLPLAQVPA